MVGSIYALIAMGVAMIYGVMHVPDFALGAKAMLGGYVAFFLTATFHQAYGAGAGGQHRHAGDPWFRRRAVHLPPAGRRRGRSTASSPPSACCWCSRTFALIAFGSSYRRILSPYDRQVIHIFGASLTMQRLMVVLIAILLMIALQLFIKFTTLGTAIRAVAQNRARRACCVASIRNGSPA